MINLLPPSYKKEISQEQNWKLTLILGLLFLIFSFSLILVLFSIRIYIQGQAESLKVLTDFEEKTMQTSGIQNFKEKVETANQKISGMEAFYKTQESTTGFLGNIFLAIPEKIYLTGLFWQKSTSQISLTGFSPTREILFELKKNLGERKEVSDIYFPASNWIDPVDINFQATFKIKE